MAVRLAQRWSIFSNSAPFRRVLAGPQRSCSGQSGPNDSADDISSTSTSSSNTAAVEDNYTDDRETELSVGGQLEQALLEIRIQRAAPDWLPLVPGGSFWIHPGQIANKQKPLQSTGPMLDPVTDIEVLSMVMPMGWPSTETARDALAPEPGVELIPSDEWAK